MHPYSCAWDGTVTGYSNTSDVTDADNHGFRITFTKREKFCGTSSWAFINKSDSNYETYVSVLLAAKMSGKVITVYTTQQSSVFCKIGYIVLR
jgi:hypothetical protein